MDLFEFQHKAMIFATYKNVDGALMLYPSLGIIGECGEVSEKIKKLIRDDAWDMTELRKEDIAQELGDCCWYLAAICDDTDSDLSMMYDMKGATMLHSIRSLQLPQIVLRMNHHAVSLATSLQNWYYLGKYHVSSRYKHSSIPHDLSNIITCIEEIARRCDFTLSDICEKNIDKLSSRMDRNKLSGSGDNR